jgi:hypothetical protein
MPFQFPRSGLFRITPRGKKVYLRKITWLDHIRTGHREVRNWIKEILLTLEIPEAIYDDKGTFISYRWLENKGKFLMVVYSLYGNTGRVKTAYTTLEVYKETRDWNKVWEMK